MADGPLGAGLSGQGAPSARLAGRGLRPRDECAVNGARFNLTLIKVVEDKNAAPSMKPLKQILFSRT
ncbi:MAG: hypothetical protein MPL62_14825, partial [Alphaproteobacteria bacterium]|nr:hypothetical protein [Alphaproteobacteria bacterium]